MLQIPAGTGLSIEGEKFQVESFVGEGGSGEVWEIRDSSGARHALKIFSRLPAQADWKAFSAKLSILARIQNEHLVPIEQCGALPFAGGSPAIPEDSWKDAEPRQLPFAIMPFADTDLFTFLAVEERDPSERIHLALQFCLGLRMVHGQMILGPGGQLERFFHGNLKPSNLLLFARGRRYLLKIADLGQSWETNPQGNPYLAPEQLQGGEIDYRTDLFAAARILREVLGDKACEFEPFLSEMDRTAKEDRIHALGKVIQQTGASQKKLFREKQCQVHLALGWKLFESGHYQYSARDFEHAVEMNPDSFLAHFSLGAALKELDRYEEALASYGRAEKLDSKNPRLHEDRGELYAEMKRYGEAVAEFQEAIALDAENASARGTLGLVYMRLGEHRKALEVFDQLIAMQGGFAPAYADRGDAWSELGEHARAADDYAKALELGIACPEEVRAKLEKAKTRIE